jgi:predicted transcriptional regulator
MPKPRSGTSYRLSDDAQDLLAKLASRLGLTKTSVLEMAIRKLAQAELDEAEGRPGAPAVPASRLAAEVIAQHHQN